MNLTSRRQSSAASLAGYARSSSPTLLHGSVDFCNSFWGVGDGGVDVLFARMRGAAKTMEEMKAFWKERAAIEEDYAKRLGKLSKMALGKDEIGELRKSLDCIRQETELQASTHLDLSRKIHADLEIPTTRFHQRQVEYKKTKQADIHQKFKNKQTQEAHVHKAREKYEQDCLRINSFTAQASLVQGKDLEKINIRLERAQQTVRTNERDFDQSASALAGTVQRWEEEWRDFCDGCQDLEEDRLDFAKDNCWNYANLISSTCLRDDESCERVRLSLEQMETYTEIQTFVSDYGTGNQIVNPPRFTNYQNADVVPQTGARLTTRSANFQRSSTRPIPPPMAINPYPSEEDPVVNAAGVGAGGGSNFGDGYSSEEPTNLNINRRLAQGNPLAHSRASSVGTPAQQLRQVLHDPHADPIDLTAESYLKIGTNAYKVDPSRDPQQSSSGARATMPSPIRSSNGNSAPFDPLKHLEDVQHSPSSTNNPRRSTFLKARNDSSDARLSYVPSVATSATSSRSGTTGLSSLSLSPPRTTSSAGSNSQHSTTPVTDYRNSAYMVVGVHPSISRPASPNPPTAAFMVPKASAQPPGADVVKEVLAGYQQSLPGERKSMILTRSPSRAGLTHSHSSSLGHNQGATLGRPVSQLGVAGIGAHGSRSSSPQPISRGPSPSPGQIARNSTFIQPLSTNGSSIGRSPSPNSLDHGREETGQRFQQHQQQSRRRSAYAGSTMSNAMPPQIPPQTFSDTPPLIQQMYPAMTSQSNYAPPPQSVQSTYSQPSSQYQPHSQQQHARYRHGSSGSYGSANGVQRGNTGSYYGNQPPAQQQPAMQRQQTQPQMMGHGQQRRSRYQQQQQQAPQHYGYPDHSGGPSASSSQPTAQFTEDRNKVLFHVKALYDYVATSDEEIDFQTGDIIAVTATPDDGWWSGELLDETRRQIGRRVFPSNFVCLL